MYIVIIIARFLSDWVTVMTHVSLANHWPALPMSAQTQAQHTQPDRVGAKKYLVMENPEALSWAEQVLVEKHYRSAKKSKITAVFSNRTA